MKKEEVFALINECFYDSKQIVPNASKSLKTIELIIECFKTTKQVPPETLKSLELNLEQVDYCIDIVSDVLCMKGIGRDWEPNSYGLKLEDAIDFLLHFSYVLSEDNPDDLRKLCKKRKK